MLVRHLRLLGQRTGELERRGTQPSDDALQHVTCKMRRDMYKFSNSLQLQEQSTNLQVLARSKRLQPWPGIKGGITEVLVKVTVRIAFSPGTGSSTETVRGLNLTAAPDLGGRPLPRFSAAGADAAAAAAGAAAATVLPLPVGPGESL